MSKDLPTLSIVVRSCNEAPRLRLMLASLRRQTAATEVVVVNDGSTDETGDVMERAASFLPLTRITHETAKGRSAASNAGARAATGTVLLFVDGDTLAAPGAAQAHAIMHRNAPAIMGRGATWHLRCTRFLHDPETGAPMRGQEARVAALSPDELDRMRVTHAQVADDFAAIERRGAPGIYPGAGPRALFEREMQALREEPDSPGLWAACCGSNLSVRRADFLAAGGFDEAIDNNEHRELALRLYQRGIRLVAVEAARTYHLTHRIGWRDPLVDDGWEAAFTKRHPEAPIGRLKSFWAGFSDQPGPGTSITSFEEFTPVARSE